jgi:hypothetical protein
VAGTQTGKVVSWNREWGQVQHTTMAACVICYQVDGW